MKSIFIITTFLCLISLEIRGQGPKVDSLENELQIAESDTSKISILIEITNAIEDKEERLSIAYQAYKLGRSVESIRHKSRSEIVYGVFYAAKNLDSGIYFIQNGTNRYLENQMMSHAANGYFLKGVAFEIANMLDSAILCYKTVHKMAAENKIHPEWGDAAYALANIHNLRGQNVEALKWALEAKKAFELGERKKEIGQTLNQIGIIYDQKGLFSEALESYLQAREFAEQTGDIDGEILINNNIGVIYDNMNNPKEAMQYYNDALEKSRIYSMVGNEATLLNNLSYIHLRNGDTTKALNLLRKSLNIDLSDTYPCFESYPLEGMGSIYIAKNKLDSAEYFLERALKTSTECEDVAALSSVYKDLGQLYSKQGKKSKALRFLSQALDIGKDAKLRLETKEALQELFKFYKRIGETSKALDFLEQYQAMTDSIYRESSIEKASQLAAEYEFRKQVAEMEKERLDAETRLSQEIKLKTNQNKLITIALGLLFLFVLTVVRGYYLIKRNNRKLRFLNDEKNKLIGIVAHDLRNPLNMIMGLKPLLEDTAKEVRNDNLDKYIELLGGSSMKMANMIDRVLDISAIENMKVNLKVEKTDLNDLVLKSINNFDLIASQKQIKIVNEIDRDNTHFSRVDPAYLEQVIDNLLSNAIKFSEKGKRIFVSLSASESTNFIEVKDEGPGIGEEEQKILFKAFRTLSSKPTNQERSTGLGLSIAHKFVKAMNGKISCESTKGEGTIFKVAFDSV